MKIPFDTWINNVTVIVDAFANRNFQESAWFGSVPTAFGSPDEMMNVYFDDVDAPEFFRENAEYLGGECVASGKQLTSLLSEYSWPMDGRFVDSTTLLKQAEWNVVMGVAKDLSEQLKTRNGSKV